MYKVPKTFITTTRTPPQTEATTTISTKTTITSTKTPEKTTTTSKKETKASTLAPTLTSQPPTETTTVQNIVTTIPTEAASLNTREPREVFIDDYPQCIALCGKRDPHIPKSYVVAAAAEAEEPQNRVSAVFLLIARLILMGFLKKYAKLNENFLKHNQSKWWW